MLIDQLSYIKPNKMNFVTMLTLKKLMLLIMVFINIKFFLILILFMKFAISNMKKT